MNRMERLINRATQFAYHSFQYEYPDHQTDLLQCADYLMMAEPDHPLRDERMRVYWAANSANALIAGLRDMSALLSAHGRNVPLYVEHIPPSFVSSLEQVGFTVVSEWIDFWLKDLQTLQLEPRPVPLIRQIHPDEVCTVAAITRACRGVSREFYGETDAAVQEWLSESDSDILVAEIDGQLVGTCFMAQYGFDHPKGSVAWLRELCVTPEYQYQGIGRALALRGLLWGQERGAKRSFLATDVENHHAIRLYEALGYRRNNERGQINMLRKIS